MAPADVAVEVIDAMFAGPPRCTRAEQEAVRDLAAAQAAFTGVRQALARSALRHRADEDGFAVAAYDLAETPAAATSASEFGAGLEQASNGDLSAFAGDPLRPLLAELVAAQPV